MTKHVAVCLLILILPGCGGKGQVDDTAAVTPSQSVGPAEIKCRADELKRTVVTADLEHPLAQGTNVLWCATMQVAWDKLCDLAGDELRMDDQPPVVTALNKRLVTRDHLDPETYVAVAGFGNEAIDKAQEELLARFQGAVSPELLPERGSLAPDDFLAYACLFADLPFQWAFERQDWPFDFGDSQVEAFGINQYIPDQEREKRAAEQVLIYDFRSEDDFIVELRTRLEEHHLILAKVPPKKTLRATIQAVLARVDGATAAQMQDLTYLEIPVLDFDILWEYEELAEKPLRSKNPRFDGSPLVALQQIRFKLDERGAVLKSEAAIWKSETPGNLIFNKPFLVMLKHASGKMPYFALWIENPELLVPFKKRTSRAG